MSGHEEENTHTHMSLHPSLSAKRGVWTGINNAVPVSNIGQLKNVDASGPIEDSALLYNSSTRKWTTKNLSDIPGIIPQRVEDLKDVNTVNPSDTPSNGEILTYSSSSNSWEYTTAPAAFSVKLEDLDDVNIKAPAEVPYPYSRIQWNGVDKWEIGPPAGSNEIYVLAGQPATNTGIISSKVPTVELGIQRALQRGGTEGTVINIEGSVVFTTSTDYILNANNISGPGINELHIKGLNTDLTSELPAFLPTFTTASAMTGLEIEVNNGGGPQMVANGWDTSLTIPNPELYYWVEFQNLNGGKLTIPAVIDYQTDPSNTGLKIYSAYGNLETTAGFTATPGFKLWLPSLLNDDLSITDDLKVIGPVKFSNILISTVADKKISFSNTKLEYVSIKPASGRTKLYFNDSLCSCHRSVFENVDIYVTGNDSKEIFNTCVFRNCTFKQLLNTKLVGCLFYNCPAIFSNDHNHLVGTDVTLHIYSDDSTATSGGAVANSVKNSTLEINNARFYMKKFSNLDPLDLPLFISNTGSMIDIRNSSVSDGVINASHTDAPDLYKPTERGAFLEAPHDGKCYIKNLAITDTGLGTRPIFLLRGKSSLWLSQQGALTAGLIDTATHTLILTSDSDVFVTHMIDQLKASTFLLGLRSNINLGPIIVKGTGNVLSDGFLNVTDCNVIGGGIEETASNDNEPNDGIHVWVGTSNAKDILYAVRSNVQLGLTPDPNTGTVILIGLWYLDNSTLKLYANNYQAETNTQITLGAATGTPTRNKIVYAINNSSIDFSQINIINEDTVDGLAIALEEKSNAYIDFPIFNGSGGTIASIASEAINLDTNSSMTLHGKLRSINVNGAAGAAAVAFNLLSVHNGSSLTILPTTDDGDGAAEKLELKRQAGASSSVPIFDIDNQSKFHLQNMASNKAADNGSGTPLEPNNNTPVIVYNSDTGGRYNFKIDNGSNVHLELCKIDYIDTSSPGSVDDVQNNSSLSFVGCFLNNATGTDHSNLFNIVDSNLNIISNKSNLSLSYTPQIQTKLANGEYMIIANRSNVKIMDMEIQAINAPTTTSQENGVALANFSNVLYYKPTNQANQTFYWGVRSQKQSKITYQDAGSNQLVASQTGFDVVLGDSTLDGGADIDYRKTALTAGNKVLPAIEEMAATTLTPGTVDLAAQTLINLALSRCQNSIAAQLDGAAPV